MWQTKGEKMDTQNKLEKLQQLLSRLNDYKITKKNLNKIYTRLFEDIRVLEELEVVNSEIINHLYKEIVYYD